MLGQIDQPAAQQRFHDDDGDAPALEFGVEVAGVDIAPRNQLGVIPVHIVHLDLDEIPERTAALGGILIVEFQQVVEYLLVAVERKAQVPDAARVALFQQEIEDPVFEETLLQDLHAGKIAARSAYRVKQVIVEMIDLQRFEGMPVHRKRRFTRIVLGVRELGGNEEFLARMALERNARHALGLTLSVHRSRVEIGDAMFDGIVHQAVDLFLVDDGLALRIGRGRPAHAAVAQQRHLVAQGTGAVCHFAGFFLAGCGLRRVARAGGDSRGGGAGAEYLDEIASFHDYLSLCTS